MTTPETTAPAPHAKGWIAVDLDGTLAKYDHWRGIEHIGAPVHLMLDRVKRWLEEGRDVRIFTARVAHRFGDPMAPTMARMYIERWLFKYLGRILPITNVKDFDMVELWDDRVVQVEANTGQVPGFSTRGL